MKNISARISFWNLLKNIKVLIGNPVNLEVDFIG